MKKKMNNLKNLLNRIRFSNYMGISRKGDPKINSYFHSAFAHLFSRGYHLVVNILNTLNYRSKNSIQKIIQKYNSENYIKKYDLNFMDTREYKYKFYSYRGIEICYDDTIIDKYNNIITDKPRVTFFTDLLNGKFL